MFQRLLTAAHGPCAALFVVFAILGFAPQAFAENPDPKAAEKPAGQEPAKEAQKVDEFAEAQHEIAGPAGNPECVWLGRRVVGLLWRDDLDTAFRHLDLYDRFGCPSAHVQASFRCLILHGSSIDPKAADSLNGRVQACWINPANPAPPPAPAAAPAAAANPAAKN
ncbi:MAG: beta-1-3, beta-1-6-glucan biosynthesis protein [Xanthobacteraceae bacterium]